MSKYRMEGRGYDWREVVSLAEMERAYLRKSLTQLVVDSFGFGTGRPLFEIAPPMVAEDSDTIYTFAGVGIGCGRLMYLAITTLKPTFEGDREVVSSHGRTFATPNFDGLIRQVRHRFHRLCWEHHQARHCEIVNRLFARRKIGGAA